MLEAECYPSVQQMFILLHMNSSRKLYFGSLMFKKEGGIWGCGFLLIKEDSARGLWGWVSETHSWREEWELRWQEEFQTKVTCRFWSWNSSKRCCRHKRSVEGGLGLNHHFLSKVRTEGSISDFSYLCWRTWWILWSPFSPFVIFSPRGWIKGCSGQCSAGAGTAQSQAGGVRKGSFI